MTVNDATARSTGTRTRTSDGAVSTARGHTHRWQWPLPAGSVLAVFEHGVTVLDVTGVRIDAGVPFRDVRVVSSEAGARGIRATYEGRGGGGGGP